MLDPAALLESLLRCYSPTGQEQAAAAFLVEQMATLGFTAGVDEAGNAVGSRGDGPDEIVLLGHIDTVPGRIEVRREGDALWGRGAVDAKGPLACFVSAAARAPLRTGWKVTVIGASAEEGDSHGARFLCSRQAPRFVVIGEPSGWQRVTLGYKGSAWFDYAVCKPLEHTAAAGGSACEAALGFWQRLQHAAGEHNQGRTRLFDQLTPALRAMHSENGDFAETARLKIGLRLPPGMSVEQAHDLCAGLAGDASLRLVDGIPAFQAEKNTALVRAFLAAVRKAGGQPGFLLKSGTSDMNIVGPAWGCPILAYGPGDSALDHTPGEHIQIPEFLTAIEVLSDTLGSLMSEGAKKEGKKHNTHPTVVW